MSTLYFHLYYDNILRQISKYTLIKINFQPCKRYLYNVLIRHDGWKKIKILNNTHKLITIMGQKFVIKNI
jgi:hypothetical protein